MKANDPTWPRAVALLVGLAVKVAVFALLGRIDAARFVYAGF